MVNLSRLIMIFDMRRRGLSISAIARKTGLCRKTIRQHLKRGLENPVYGPRHPRPRLLDPYEGYLRERVELIVPMIRARLGPCDTATAVVFLCTSNPTCIVVLFILVCLHSSHCNQTWEHFETSAAHQP